MKILCLVDKYYPDASANTVCCNHIMNYFKEKGHQVDFLSLKWSIDDDDYDIINGSNVIKIETYQYDILKKYYSKYGAKKWNDLPYFFRKLKSLLQKLRFTFKRIFTGNLKIDTLNYEIVVNKVKFINYKYDCIVLFSQPAAFNILVSELINNNIADKWYPIFLDPFVYNKTFSKFSVNKRKRIINTALKKANHIFMVDGIISENLKKGYDPDYHKKTTEIFIPALTKIDLPMPENKDDITLIYAGKFYKDIRRPEGMMDILSNLSLDCILKVFGSGCEKVVESYKTKFNSCNLYIGGQIEHSKCLQEISNADILINLGNTISNQMPSKILEYIGFGKPIIHFYFNEEDMCLPVLEKYPLAITVNVNNYTEEDIEKVKKFVQENKGKQLNYEEATANLKEYRVENIAGKIYNIVVE